MRPRTRSKLTIAVASLLLVPVLLSAPDAAARPKPIRTLATTTTAAPTTTTTAAPTTTTTTAPPPPNGGYANRLVETFSSAEWWRAWGMTARPYNTGILADTAPNTVLGVRFNRGSHDGTSWRLPTGTADDVHIRYRLLLPANWDPSASASNVKFPGFGSPEISLLGVCLGGCGNSPSNGITSYSARGDIHANGRPGYYVYDASMSQLLGTSGTGYRWGSQTYTPGRWYTIDLRIRMNTPGVRDGLLQAWVDGVNVFNGTNYNFRLVNTLHVGSAWFDFYYGGSGLAPQEMILRIDDVVVEW